MKKILTTIIGLAAGAALVHAQGYLNWANAALNIRTNTSILGSPGTPDTAAGFGTVVSGATVTSSVGNMGNLGGYYYTILLWNGVGSDSSAADLTDGDFSQVYQEVGGVQGGAELATNGAVAGWLNGSGGGSAQLWDVPGGTAADLVLVGWSMNLGSDWSTVEAELLANTWNANGFFGYDVGSFAPGGSSPGQAAINWWPASSMVLYSVPVPEPTTLALAGLGGMALLAFRRRNKKS